MLELSPRWARNMVTALTRLNGHPVGVVANQPHHLGGVIDIAASEKAASFIRRCDAFGLPLVVLVDTPGFLPGTKQEGLGVIRHGAGLLHAFSAARVPKATVVLRKAYGGGFITMNSRELGADLVLAWPGAEIGVLGARQAVGIIHRRAIEASPNPDAEHDRLAAEYAEQHLRADGGRRRWRRRRGDRAGRDERAPDLGAHDARRSQRTKEDLHDDRDDRGDARRNPLARGAALLRRPRDRGLDGVLGTDRHRVRRRLLRRADRRLAPAARRRGLGGGERLRPAHRPRDARASPTPSACFPSIRVSCSHCARSMAPC